uniref:G-protein coupled receptors family 1 profile domain-containing protein n=1 Tax=Ditylenchus dipsaci TaxID=166011 RepID=A0A915DAI1_9BILA
MQRILWLAWITAFGISLPHLPFGEIMKKIYICCFAHAMHFLDPRFCDIDVLLQWQSVRKTSRGRMGMVSYHTNAETIDTMYYNNVTKSQGVCFAANPKIMINDELNEALNSQRGSVDGGQQTRLGSNGSATNPVVKMDPSGKHLAKINRSRAIRVSFLLVAAYIVCWLPYNGLSLIQFVDPDLFNKHANQVYCLHGMIVFNS